MKKALLTFGMLFLAVVLFTANAQDATPAKIGGAEITFEKETHDYGKIKQHANGECEFTFKNTGTEPLLISNSRGSCGCTVPTWPREPIAPGASATIKVKYDTKRIGAINKSVTIQSNAVNAPTKIIRIKGEVLAPDNTATPIKPTEGPVQH
ncbi:MAG: DUF1573 domain-containing protein [Flavobacteriales bacterium]|jgi:hypothetical protein|nr:DUF1573 domain-containing protein [Flavobacteriales bacterium]